MTVAALVAAAFLLAVSSASGASGLRSRVHVEPSVTFTLPPAAAGLNRAAPNRARLDGLAGLCDLAGAAVPGAYFLTKS